MKRKGFGEDYPGLVDQLCNLGNVYYDQGKLEMAEKYYLKSLELKKKAYGIDYSI